MKEENKIARIIRNADGNKSRREEEEARIIKEFLILRCRSSMIGIQLEYLREVFDLKDDNEIFPIPFTPSHIVGIVNVRGEIIPVLSLSEIIGIEEKEFNYLKLIIIEHTMKIAFPVKEIVDLKAIDIKELRNIKDATKNVDEQLLTGEFHYNEEVVSVLDVPKFYGSHFIL